MNWLLTELTDSWVTWIVAVSLAIRGTLGVVHWGRFALSATAVADGTVVGSEKTSENDDAPPEGAMISFIVKGVEFKIADWKSSSLAPLWIGDRVRVFLPPRHPSKAQPGRWRFVLPWLGAALAGWLILGAILWWRFS